MSASGRQPPRPGRWGETLGTAARCCWLRSAPSISGRPVWSTSAKKANSSSAAAWRPTSASSSVGPVRSTLCLILCSARSAVRCGPAWRRAQVLARRARGLSTLLLVTVGGQAVAYGLEVDRFFSLRGKPRQPKSGQRATGRGQPAAAPEIFGNEFPLTVTSPSFCACGSARTFSNVWGFRLRMLGRNPRAAQRSGVSETKYGATALMLSGGSLGLAGAACWPAAGLPSATISWCRASPPTSAGPVCWLPWSPERRLWCHPRRVRLRRLRTGSSFVGSTGVEGRITDVIQGCSCWRC